MNGPRYRDVMLDGIWRNNVTFVQVLGLCPLMAVTTSATNGLGIGVLTMLVMAGANLLVSLLRPVTPNQIRIPIFILIIAFLVTVLDLTMNAWMHDLHKVLGLFIPLIVANCAPLGRAEAFAMKNRPIAAMLDGLATGIGFTFGVTSVGAVREILGSGTLFSGASILLGPHFSLLEMHLLPGYRGFLLMLLPPGGFVVMGLLLALGRLRRVVLARLFKPTRVVPATTATATAGGCHV